MATTVSGGVRQEFGFVELLESFADGLEDFRILLPPVVGPQPAEHGCLVDGVRDPERDPPHTRRSSFRTNGYEMTNTTRVALSSALRAALNGAADGAAAHLNAELKVTRARRKCPTTGSVRPAEAPPSDDEAAQDDVMMDGERSCGLTGVRHPGAFVGLMNSNTVKEIIYK
ncbi:hypothetical protein EYF80_046649 [Liparis tanakae]|uniref:Uncharacterized protein n=1 Tax=Liparis tanakae TaxID=230148 RepID=A0A4Z2FR35_9TELE|nr:hypothetical protein EYF80_046649 [Liparis tanakae]